MRDVFVMEARDHPSNPIFFGSDSRIDVDTAFFLENELSREPGMTMLFFTEKPGPSFFYCGSHVHDQLKKKFSTDYSERPPIRPKNRPSKRNLRPSKIPEMIMNLVQRIPQVDPK